MPEEEKTPEQLEAERLAAEEEASRLELEGVRTEEEEKKGKKGEEETVPLARVKRMTAETKQLKARIKELEASPAPDREPSNELSEAEAAALAANPKKFIADEVAKSTRKQTSDVQALMARQWMQNLPIAQKDAQFMEHIDSISTRHPEINELPVETAKLVFLAIYEQEVAKEIGAGKDGAGTASETITKRGLNPSSSASPGRRVVKPTDVDSMTEGQRAKVWEALGASPVR